MNTVDYFFVLRVNLQNMLSIKPMRSYPTKLVSYKTTAVPQLLDYKMTHIFVGPR